MSSLSQQPVVSVSLPAVILYPFSVCITQCMVFIITLYEYGKAWASDMGRSIKTFIVLLSFQCITSEEAKEVTL